ncbi:cytochrome P450 [Bradyrhizobium sp. ISRA443]|uniref:cytochrome P450 n=1 Tax=unclassified Bradyrhizobium TaxID=2631580 RepID=UPI0024794A59|nr:MULTISPECIES: cytochrome P450 [unclassified Bradyrhizobium]WGR91314.1 cytochrome P450 [Bradyrhizobium sp. ISRA435]WGS01541.1 cytochrome P450 [Bradyrhizobium sp. ISRA436]WGS08428.1 cytochrome P450 [Bradyrhizobium sp. ISRA437]WGS15316.1 cytochrome P450 [Bradyrhizobium sp. ISRA443]
MTSTMPVVTDISYQDLLDDPYPIFRRLRATAPAVFVETAKLTLVTRFDDITKIERDPATYSADNPTSLVNKVMGPTFMRKDGAEHAIGRKAIEPSFRPAMVKEHWAPKFTAICERLIDALAGAGEADLFNALAAPMASLSLMEMIGFEPMPWQTLAEWSQALIDGAGNYAGDPEIERKAMQAGAAVDAAIEVVLDHHRSHPNPSILSSMVNADPPMSIEAVRANIKVIIGGGLNEPRDAILTLVLGLLENPAQKRSVLAKPELWPAALEEAVRWISPIGMYPRRVTRDVDLSGVTLPQDLQIGLCIGAANRDDKRFADPDNFDVSRPKQSHLAFGAGPHFCAGTWVSRLTVGKIVGPMLFERLRNLRLRDDAPPVVRGWVFRGPVSLPVRWDA